MSVVYVGNLDRSITPQELEITRIKIPKLRSSSSVGYAFVEFKDRRGALSAIRSWKGKFNWRVELSHNSRFVYPEPSVTVNCYSCGGLDHVTEDCFKDIKNKGVRHSQRGSRKKNRVASTSTLKPVPPPPPQWLDMLEDIMVNIFRKLGQTFLLCSVQKVCTKWRKICRDPTMWRVIDMRKPDVAIKVFRPINEFRQMLCRQAIDLGQRQVTEINIKAFLSDELLKYIAERCGQLRCLRLSRCELVSGKILSFFVRRFRMLEELYLVCSPIRPDDIEAIGQSCPMLKKFALNCRGCCGVLKGSEKALAVANSMPELCHLQMVGSWMTNEAVEAILNGCPKLVSLDLRSCTKLDFRGELGKRCAKQIKNLRHPRDLDADADNDVCTFNEACVPAWAMLV